MIRPAPKGRAPGTNSFPRAIEAAEHLTQKAGLGAIEEGKSRIHVGKARIFGSVNLDRDCKQAYPQSNRWDYLVGVERGGKPHAIFVEVHSAHTSSVHELEKKLSWLQETYLPREPQARLRRLPAEFHWVASGKVAIPAHTPQARLLKARLRGRGLRGPVTRLDLE